MKSRARSEFFLKFVSELKARQALPKNIEISELGPVVMASIFDTTVSEIITESIYTGMDMDPETAVLKGLVEMLERKAFFQGFKEILPSCNTERSDGFAAFPIGISTDAKISARNNAVNEAVERYVWARWWDDSSVGHKKTHLNFKKVNSPTGGLLQELDKIAPLRSIVRLEPFMSGGVFSEGPVSVAIYFAFLDTIGVISGGACGPIKDIEATNFRAASELFRHGLAIHRIRSKKLEPNTFYEKRLAYFGLSQAGENLARARMDSVGTKSVILPKLRIDSAVPHSLSDMVAVHRCFFENQPPFVGGNLERLCL